MNDRKRQRKKALNCLPWYRKIAYLEVELDTLVKNVAKKISEMEISISNAIKYIAKILGRND